MKTLDGIDRVIDESLIEDVAQFMSEQFSLGRDLCRVITRRSLTSDATREERKLTANCLRFMNSLERAAR